MNWKRLSLFAAMGLPLLAVADDYPRPQMRLQVAPYDIHFRDYNFPSGLRVVFQEDHSQPVVSISYVNDRGSTADPEGKEGIAHLIEHLWFRSHQKGPDGKPLPKIWDIYQQMGVQMNAFTADDQTVYTTMAPKQHLGELLRLERLRMISAVEGVESETMIVERDVVRNELRMRYENSAAAAYGFAAVKMFPKSHPYGRSAYAGIGSHESLDAITIDDVHSFVKENYGPDKTTLVIAGDVNLEDSWKLISENLGYDVLVDPKNPDAELKPLPPKPHLPSVVPDVPPPVQPAEVKGELVGVTTERGPVQDPFVLIGWSLPAGWRENSILMQTAVNRMWPAISQELDPEWDPTSNDFPITGGCGVNEQVMASMAYCSIDIHKGDDGNKIISTALDGLYHAWTNAEDETMKKLLEQFFNYSKNATMASIFQGVDLTLSLYSDQATQATMYAHYTGDLQYYSRQFEAVNKVNSQDVQAFAQKYLNRDRAVALIMQPYDEGDLVLDSSNSKYRGANRSDGAAPMAGADKLTPDVIAKSFGAPDVSKVVQTTLPNGMKLVVMPYSISPLVQVAVNFKGGLADSTYKGQMDFANEMYRSQSAAEALSIAGFDGGSMGSTNTTFEISASVANLNEALYVVRDHFDEIIPDTNGRLDYAAVGKKSVFNDQKTPEWWSGKIQRSRMFPNHYLSEWLNHGDYDTMKKWGNKQVMEVLQSLYRPENATMLVVGNVDPTKVIASVQTYFAGWTGLGAKPATPIAFSGVIPPLPPPPARQVILFDKKISSQSNVTYYCQLSHVNDGEEAAVSVLGDVLDGDAWLALREETGASYGANAFGQVYPGGGATLGMASLVQNNFAAKAVQAFIGLGEKAKAGKLDPLMVATKKYGLAQQFVIGQQSTSMMMTRILGLLQLNRPIDYYSIYAKRLGAVDIPAMQKLMDPCVGHEVVSVVGPLSVIEPLFKASGLPYEVFDWEKARLDYAAQYKIKLPKTKPEDEKK